MMQTSQTTSGASAVHPAAGTPSLVRKERLSSPMTWGAETLLPNDGLVTLEARTIPGLHFIGEVVDVTGWLGGYNFQWAWASGHAAGSAA